MNALILALVLTTGTLVLRTGERIELEGVPREDNGVLTFRSGGLLYSMPSSEVERIDSSSDSIDTSSDSNVEGAKPVRRLKASEEEKRLLLEELERNHSGGPALRQKILDQSSRERLAAAPPPPVTQGRDEWSWRRESRGYEERVVRAREELQLLESRVDDLQSQIHSFFALGLKPNQFSYQTLQLERARAQIPAARLDVTRAEREYAQFREDARRQGVMPGWLR